MNLSLRLIYSDLARDNESVCSLLIFLLHARVSASEMVRSTEVVPKHRYNQP